MALPSFEPDFASPSDWAAMYRAAGIQVVPANMPRADKEWKFPALATWKTFQEELVPASKFDEWYGSKGEFCSQPNMGMVTGRCSGNALVIDLDEYKNVGALQWWQGILAVHNHGIEPETPQQITGGGGRQLVFRAPPTWRGPVASTPIGVDIRGQGGFAMLPPSKHLSGKTYSWKEGCAPWEIEFAVAPDWLTQAVDELVAKYGDGTSPGRTEPSETTPSPAQDIDAFGQHVDRRDRYMRNLIWAAVVNWYKECPIPPTDIESSTRMKEVYAAYERKAKSRLPADDGTSNADRLEREGRGHTLFIEKWRRAIGKWSTDIAVASQKPLEEDEWLEATKTEPIKANAERFKFEKIGDLRKLPPTQWLVKEWVPEGATGIFYGKWAAGKSFICFDLALHLAYGMTDWHGVPLPGVPCHILIIAREGHQGFVSRIDAFKKHYGLVDDSDHITFMRGSVSFMRDEDFSALAAAIKADATPHQLVIVDTVARVLPGVDMNEQQTVTLFMERISVIGGITGAATIGVHHENKNGGMMGSVYFEANADFVFEVKRDGEEEGPLTSGQIVCTKMKDGEDRWKRSVSYTKIPLSILPEGPSSLVVQRIGGTSANSRTTSAWPDRDTCQRILGAINEAWISGKPWSTSPQSPDRFGPRMMNVRFELSAKIAREMLQTWLANDVLSIEIRDTHTKQKGLKVVGQI